MVLNEDKFELLCHTAGKSNPLHELLFTAQFFEYTTADGTVIMPSDTVKDLGATVTPTLSWSPHINITSNKGRQLISWVLVYSQTAQNTR